jgi:Helix-turn-helix domain
MSGESGFKLPLFVHSSIDDAGLSPGAFRVLCHLTRRAGNKGVAFPGIRNIAKTCHMNCGTVIDAIRELEQFRLVLANRKPGRPTVYRLFPEGEPGSEVVPKTTGVEAASVAYLGNSDQSRGVAHLGNGVLPTQVTECYLTNRADQVPEPPELPEGTPIRYSAVALTR